MWTFTRRERPGPERLSGRRKNERDLKLEYIAHVIADFHRLPRRAREELLEDLPGGLKNLLQEVDASGQIQLLDDAQLDWGEIATLEDKILARDDEVGVRRKAWQIRSRYARLAGPDRYQAYLASGPPDANDPEVRIEALRADLRRVLAATHFTYSMAMVRETNRRRVLNRLLQWTLALCVPLLVAAAVLVRFTDAALAGVLCIVFFFGCLGAYVSIQRRLQNTADGGDPVIGILALHEFNQVQRFPFLAGGVFAVVLYFALAGKFMEGSLFPVVGLNGVPDGMENWAKLFIWSFIAGFAERLVPDTLDRLVNQAKLASETTPMAAASASGASQKAFSELGARAPRRARPADHAKVTRDFFASSPTPPPV